uniref:Uncharacterized protein n=1 Tax=Tetraodon nigroviridis TaxID=99883 RepID=H3C8Y4_TETNG
FLRRTAEASLHERIRFHEPCVVVSETVDKAYMHVLLSDERVFLTEHAPRTLTVAVSFGRVRDIELVNDLPGFLRGKHRQLCQHTRITYVTQEPVPRRAAWASKDFCRDLIYRLFPSIQMLSLKVKDMHHFILIFASWSCCQATQRPVRSREKTAQVFARLSSALLQEGVGVERLHLLLQQLRRAAHRNLALSRLFWKSRDVCVFLVQTLEESLHGCRSAGGVHTADRLLLSSLVVQTLATLCREADGDPARLDLLSAENAALASRLLLVLCDPATQTQGGDCEVSRLLLTSRALALPFNLLHHLQAWLQEYLDASCSLLFELLLLGHEASRCSPADSLLSVGWILRVLQPHPHLPSFLGYQVKQVVLVLSDLQGGPLSPAQAVLLYQRCGLLLACLQHNNQLSQHLRSHFREEFRYFVKPSCAEEKLPPHYPIRRPTVRLVEELLRRSR